MKKVLYFILAIIAIILIVAAIAPKNYAVDRSVIVDKDINKVFGYVVNLKNQDTYSAWAKLDPNSKKTYTGIDGTVGFISAWESDHKDVGVGEQEITAIDPGKRVDYEIRFKKPYEGKGLAAMTTEKVDEKSTKVVWSFTGEMPFPMNLMILTGSMEKSLGPALKEGLDGLKKNIESMVDPLPVAIDSTQVVE